MIPYKLKTSDKIGIVSPSSPITKDCMEQFNKGIKYLNDSGFEVAIAKNAFANTAGYSATPQEKAEDINNMFADKSIKAIICSQGGENANACLPYLDWETIKENPKIFLGISDITVLLNSIHAKTGLVTFHGNDVIWGFGTNPEPYDAQEFMDRLIHGKTGIINGNGVRATIRGGTATGKLIGGNIHCLLKLAGTTYLPEFENSILFLESFGFDPEDCDCAFNHLKQMGVFDKIKGVIVGYIYDEFAEQRDVHMEDVLLNVSDGYEFPILKINDFGHNCPNTVIPIGVTARLDSTRKEIVILEDCAR